MKRVDERGCLVKAGHRWIRSGVLEELGDVLQLGVPVQTWLAAYAVHIGQIGLVSGVDVISFLNTDCPDAHRFWVQVGVGCSCAICAGG